MSSVLARLFQQAYKEANARTLIKARFENLRVFERTSNVDGRYNCIAHAAQDNRRKWWPVPLESASNDVHWPEGADRTEKVESFITAFHIEGKYIPCDDLDTQLEEGYEKVALFIATKDSPMTRKGTPTHMARQLPCGKWTSKLGGEWDIRHDTAEEIQGGEYGELKSVLKRKRQFNIVRVPDEKEEADTKSAISGV